MIVHTFLSLALFFCAYEAKSPVTQNLTGTWIVKQATNDHEYRAAVPGGIYSDLMEQNVIDDVFTFYHDNDTRWIGNSNWTYTLNFTIEADLLAYEEVKLVFEGVDTFAQIELNNVIVGTTQNMFVRYMFDVKNVLKLDGNNTLKVTFLNAPEVALKLNTEQLKKYRIPWECPPDEYRGECHINMIRKMQASFSWDWGPSFPSLGIWKPVYLQAFDDSAIDYVVGRVEISPDQKNYVLVVDTYFIPNKVGHLNGTITPNFYVKSGEGLYKTYDVNETLNENGELLKSISLSVDKTLVDLWWPNGYGEQPLYELVINFTSGIDNSYTVEKVKIGIRFVELVQEPLSTGGTFYFKINGVPIFAKGSNEIPINILPERGSDQEKVRYLLESTKEANMNMLRVWGGGVYESDYFYEVADELGIMIWQDFMFACSLYPATDEFLNNSRIEVIQNMKRLYNHPSIVVYAGNNENEKILANNNYNTSDLFDTYKEDYVALYIDTIRTEVIRISGGQGIFIASSPTNGNLTEKEGWVGSNPKNQKWGDDHFYNYDSDPWNSTSFPIPRFCSEYGYQSMPFEDAWMTATNDTKDIDISSDFMNWRQHHPSGNSQMAALLGHNLELPSSNSTYYTSAFIYLSQIYAAQGTKVETEHYRRYRSYLTSDSKGYTMGALYWQLNDVWVAPTWSSIDFTGRWKMLHYFAKNFFADIIVTGHFDSSGNLQLYVVNDHLIQLNDIRVSIRIYNYTDFVPVNETVLQVNVSAACSQLVQNISIDTVLNDNKCDKNSCFFHFVVQNFTANGEAISPENYAFPGKLKQSNLASPTVKIVDVVESGVKNNFNVTVASSNIALFVWLDSHQVSGRFSDNGFLQVEPSRTVSFRSDVDVTVEELQGNLTVTHLKDSKWA